MQEFSKLKMTNTEESSSSKSLSYGNDIHTASASNFSAALLDGGDGRAERIQRRKKCKSRVKLKFVLLR